MSFCRRKPLARSVLLTLFVLALTASLAVLFVGAARGRAESLPFVPAAGTGAVAGRAWNDLDGDGALDAGEPGLPNVSVQARSQDGQVVATAVTDAVGAYRISDLVPGFYQVTAQPPPGFELTTRGSLEVFIAAEVVLTLDFGAQFVPTPTPTATTPPVLDAEGAERAYCGGVYTGDTGLGRSNVSRYGCYPAWDERGPELVYRIELDANQTLSVALQSASADLDLFLLRYVYPESCVAAGDTYLKLAAEPGVYLLAVDGYQGAAGTFSLRVDCPLGVQATATPTLTPSPTPTATATFTPSPTYTPSPTSVPQEVYLPLVVRARPTIVTEPITLALQHGVDGYTGGADTTLSAWEPETAYGEDDTLRLFYSRPPKVSTQAAPLLRFDLGLLPTQAQIHHAQLELYLVSAALYDLYGQTHGLLRPWDELAATWQQPAAGQTWGEPGAQGVETDHMAWASDRQHIQEGGWYAFDVTALVSLWAQDPARNHGLILLAQAGDSNANVEARFASQEHKTPAYHPRLVISYSVPLSAARP